MTFQPGLSLMHRLHPVVKLAWLLWLTIAVFVFNSALLSLAVAGCAVGLLWLSGVAPWRIPGVRLWLTLGVLVVVTHALAYPQEDDSFGPRTAVGLAAGLHMMARLLAIILASALFVTTTEPISLAYALMRMGVPYRWGFALVAALRLVPVCRVEAHHVYQAQLVRGMGYDTGGPRRWWLMLRHLCLPLLVSALRTSDSLSLSMEGRAFGLYTRRTFIREVRVGGRDLMAGILLVVSILALVWYRLP
ncbi:MAG: energy-coupling factor transporter transmembrane component T [Planctomycetota bacterium]